MVNAKELTLLICGIGEDSWESLGLQEYQISQSERKSTLNIHWKDWCSDAPILQYKAPIFWPPDINYWLIRKDPDAGKDWRQEEKGMTEDEMAGWHHWLNGHESESGRWWWTGKHGVLQSRGWQRVRHDWATWLLFMTEQQQKMVKPGAFVLLIPDPSNLIFVLRMCVYVCVYIEMHFIYRHKWNI